MVYRRTGKKYKRTQKKYRRTQISSKKYKRRKKKSTRRVRKVIRKVGGSRPNVTRVSGFNPGEGEVVVGDTSPEDWRKVGEKQIKYVDVGEESDPDYNFKKYWDRQDEEELKKIENCYPKDKYDCGSYNDSKYPGFSSFLAGIGLATKPQVIGWSKYKNKIKKGETEYCCRDPREMNIKEQIDSRKSEMPTVVRDRLPNTQGYEPKDEGLTHDIFPQNVTQDDIIEGTYYAAFIDDKNDPNKLVYINILNGRATENPPDEVHQKLENSDKGLIPKPYPGNIREDYNIE